MREATQGAPRVAFCAPGAKPDAWLRELRRLLPNADVFAWNGGKEAAADYALVWTPPDAFFAAQPKLKALFNLGAGVDGLLRSAALPSHVPVIRIEDAGMAPLMAEYVCQAAIRHARQLDRIEADTRKGIWNPGKPSERGDYPLGVMGLGAIGLLVAEALASFGFPVSGWSRTRHTHARIRCHAGDAGLDAFLRSTRILVCVLPLTPETENILDAATLNKLLPDAYLINVARGAHLVDDDLLALLDAGRLAGATLDVFREEPLPAAHRFWGHPKITLTPHCSALTQRDRTLAQIAQKIEALERGDAVTGVVELERGY